MTREQAINSMISHGFTVEQAGEIIKAVTPQEPVIDKIRAEIDNALSDGMIHKKTVLGIIDKYKAENNL